MKIIDRKNYFATVCEVYAMLSIGKILLEAFTHYKWGIDQMNFICFFDFSEKGHIINPCQNDIGDCKR